MATEATVVNQARSLAGLAFLAATFVTAAQWQAAAKLNCARNTLWTLTVGNFSGDIDEVLVSNVVR